MKRLTFIFAALLFPVITSVWAAPPFPQKSAERDNHQSQGNDHKSQDNVAAAGHTERKGKGERGINHSCYRLHRSPSIMLDIL